MVLPSFLRFNALLSVTVDIKRRRNVNPQKYLSTLRTLAGRKELHVSLRLGLRCESSCGTVKGSGDHRR